MKFEFKDWIAMIGAVTTVGSVLVSGGAIKAELEATTLAVREMAPIVNRLDATTARLEVRADANLARIDDLARRVERLEGRK